MAPAYIVNFLAHPWADLRQHYTHAARWEAVEDGGAGLLHDMEGARKLAVAAAGARGGEGCGGSQVSASL